MKIRYLIVAVSLAFLLSACTVQSDSSGIGNEDINLLPSPGNINAEAIDQTQIAVQWDDVPGATGYVVYISESQTGPYEKLGAVEQAAGTAYGLSSETTYWLKVAAVNEVGEGKQSAPVSAKTMGRPTSRTNSSKTNQTWTLVRNDWLYGKSEIEITLTELVSGKKAWDVVKKANMFNEAPETGYEYILAKFKFKVISAEEEPFDITEQCSMYLIRMG